MDEAAVTAQASDAGRMEALEQEVRLLASRLAGWVEAQLVQSLDDRRHDMNALRAELLFSFKEQLAATQAEPAAGEALEQRVRAAMSRLSDSVETRLGEEAEHRHTELDAVRADLVAAVKAQASEVAAAHAAVQDVARSVSSLGARLDEVAGQVAAAAEASAAFRAEADALPERVDAFEQRVKAAMGRLTDSVETRLAETRTDQDPPLEELRSSLRAAAGRTDALEPQVQALRSELEADRRSIGERLETLAAQITSATDTMATMQATIAAGPGRADALEQRVKSAVSRLAESVDARLAEMKTELETAVGALRGRSSKVRERLDSVEELHREVDERFSQMVEAKLAEVVEGRRAEFDQVRRELEEELASQLRQGRNEIGTAVADAHRRFAVSVDRLEEQIRVLTDQAAAARTAVARADLVPETVASDGRRIEALEEHTRRTDARLGDLVEAKLAELGARRLAEIDGIRAELRAALDSHLAEIRAEVATSVGESRTVAAAAATRLEERLTSFGALEERIEHALQVRLGALDTGAADVATGRVQVAQSVGALERKAARANEKVEQRLDGLAGQVDALVKAAATEGGALAPVRSDVRVLQAQIAELAEAVAGLRPRRKVAAPAAKAAPTKKAAARKTGATPAKASARRRAQ